LLLGPFPELEKASLYNPDLALPRGSQCRLKLGALALTCTPTILAFGCATGAAGPASSAAPQVPSSTGSTADYEPEAYLPVDPSLLPTFSWPPHGIKTNPGAVACLRFRQPLGNACAFDGETERWLPDWQPPHACCLTVCADCGTCNQHIPTRLDDCMDKCSKWFCTQSFDSQPHD
jgi:hypothetical protein